jgi:hypothetical protein
MLGACAGEVGTVAKTKDAPDELGLAANGPMISGDLEASSGYLLYRGSPVDPWCGAVLVGPSKVLTAGRCVQDVGERALSVGFGALRSSKAYQVKSIKLPLGYRSEGDAIEDIAVLDLREPVDDVPTAILYVRTLEPESVSLVSYAFVPAGNTGERRIFEGLADRASDAGLSAVFPGAETNCHGEVGAGLFLRTEGVSDQLLGIGSSGSYDSPHPLSPFCVGRLTFASVAHNRRFLAEAGVVFADVVK